MQGPEKNSYKEFDNEKKFLQLENSPPPLITFLMVRPLLLWFVLLVCYRGKSLNNNDRDQVYEPARLSAPAKPLFSL